MPRPHKRGNERILTLFELFGAHYPYSPDLTDDMKKFYKKLLRMFHTDKHMLHPSATTDLVSKTLIKAWTVLSQDRNAEWYYTYGLDYFISHEEEFCFGLIWEDINYVYKLLLDCHLLSPPRRTKQTPKRPRVGSPKPVEVIELSDTDEPASPEQSNHVDPASESNSEQDDPSGVGSEPSCEPEHSDHNDSRQGPVKRSPRVERLYEAGELESVVRCQDRRGALKFLVKLRDSRAEVWVSSGAMMDSHSPVLEDWASRYYVSNPRHYRNLLQKYDWLSVLLK